MGDTDRRASGLFLISVILKNQLWNPECFLCAFLTLSAHTFILRIVSSISPSGAFAADTPLRGALMFIKVKELELRKITFDEAFTPGVIDLGQEIQQNTPLLAGGHAELIEENRGAREVVEDIRLVGNFSTQVTARCARCLEPVSQDVKESFDLLYRPLGVDAKGDDNSI